MSGGSEDEESEWRFTLEEIDERQDDQQPTETTVIESENGDGPEQVVTQHDHEDTNVAGSLDTEEEPLEPGQVELENALFVILGIALVVGLILAAVLGI